MKVLINKPCRVNVLSGEVEVDQTEAIRLFLLGLAEVKKEYETRTVQKETKKAKK